MMFPLGSFSWYVQRNLANSSQSYSEIPSLIRSAVLARKSNLPASVFTSDEFNSRLDFTPRRHGSPDTFKYAVYE